VCGVVLGGAAYLINEHLLANQYYQSGGSSVANYADSNSFDYWDVSYGPPK